MTRVSGLRRKGRVKNGGCLIMFLILATLTLFITFQVVHGEGTDTYISPYVNSLDSPTIVFEQQDQSFMMIREDGQVFINDVEIERLSDLEIKKAMISIADSMQEYSMVDLLSDQTDRLLLEIERLKIALKKCEEEKQ
ncbi:hypothetical protein LCGC14_1256180 [marine sediment metagenome]|uniref:Uncharacterized protein n=1 Tax=marine sediment metagenome TaxID=412755 RepID=A0A0F9LN94_9ZZZZ